MLIYQTYYTISPEEVDIQLVFPKEFMTPIGFQIVAKNHIKSNLKLLSKSEEAIFFTIIADSLNLKLALFNIATQRAYVFLKQF
jgi:hypothetical protein